MYNSGCVIMCISNIVVVKQESLDICANWNDIIAADALSPCNHQDISCHDNIWISGLTEPMPWLLMPCLHTHAKTSAAMVLAVQAK